MISNICRKRNKYILTNNYGIGYTSKGEEFYFDLEDYDLIKDFCWWINDNRYVINTQSNDKNIRMHRLIMNAPNNKFVDHINHNKNDNRKCNLRLVTNQQNTMNAKLKSNNTSGVTGVYWKKDRQKWQAKIMVNYKNINLGTYINKEDAIKARKEAEEKYFERYSYSNSIKGER